MVVCVRRKQLSNLILVNKIAGWMAGI